jgi:glycosyltransferase involved in cell wall biosynthesis
LYNTLDLYVVGSRCEGGPQAIFECAATQTPIISTPVGYATQILGEFDLGGAIYKIEHEGQQLAGLRAAIRNINVDSNYENVMNLFMRQGMDSFIRFFKRI